MAWVAGNDVTTGDLITAAQWNNYLGATGSLEYLYDVPSVRVYHNVDQSFARLTPTFLAFNSERFDTDTIHDTVTNNSRLTCKTAGKYLIAAHIKWDVEDGIGYMYLYFNGATIIAQARGADLNSTGKLEQNVATIYDLAVNDYVQVKINHSATSAKNVKYHANYSPEFMMARISP